MSSLRDRDTDRDLSDYRQPRDYNQDRDRSERSRDRDQDREISLGTGTILGIFFALALLCAVFFAFGYSMGRKSAQPTVTSADALPPTSIFGGTKPSPGSPLSVSSRSAAVVPASDSSSTDTPANSSSDDATPVSPNTPVPSRSSSASSTEAVPAVIVPKPATRPLTSPAAQASPAEIPMPQISTNGTVMVQVAAVSHQEDADLLLAALKKRGYTVFIRQEPQDHLMHVQVGPFATRKDADAMRQRLLADGYNAIVK